MLPLEAIELGVFRCRHEHDTFWCGLLLGGCGGQLTTKLYTDLHYQRQRQRLPVNQWRLHGRAS
ncbi:hypothetical protein [Streptomyces acidicola]|uniref:hypothetical protein n=1 Tax=Streptomyces acidicola TaxID=2596892 RepID=UPI0034401A69